MSWHLQSTASGWNAAWNGKPFGCEKLDYPTALNYVLRLGKRYPEGPDYLFRVPQRRGPYTLQLADGERVNLPDAIRSKKAARNYLLRKMDRRRLPRGSRLINRSAVS